MTFTNLKGVSNCVLKYAESQDLSDIFCHHLSFSRQQDGLSIIEILDKFAVLINTDRNYSNYI